MTTSSDSATFNYTVVVTKSAATDSGWKVTGTITVTNPNVYTVSNVTVSEQGVDNGGICALDTSGAVGTLTQGQTASVDYTCTYAQAPSPAAGTNTANVTWTLPASGDAPATPQSGTVTQAFAFGDPTTIVHDTVNVERRLQRRHSGDPRWRREPERLQDVHVQPKRRGARQRVPDVQQHRHRHGDGHGPTRRTRPPACRLAARYPRLRRRPR